MFTGIIEEVGIIRSIKKTNHTLVLTIAAGKVIADMKEGDSINTNGVCLTVTSFSSDSFMADVMPETYQRSGLSKLV